MSADFQESIMRKKLLALLMCATMVLGTAATAFAYSTDDLKTAETIVKQYNKLAGELNSGNFGEYTSKPVTFGTVYVPVQGDAKQIGYSWAFDKNSVAVKVDKDTKPFVQVTGAKVDATVDTQTVTNVRQLVVNSSVTLASVTAGSVIKTNEATPHYYYVKSVSDYAAGDALTANVATTAVETSATATVAGKSLDVREYFAADHTIISGENKNDPRDAYLVDPDNFIPLLVEEDKTIVSEVCNKYGLFTAYTTLASNSDYVVTAQKATETSAIAEAVAEGTISDKAVAVKFGFYKKAKADNRNYANGAKQYGFNTLDTVLASRNSENVSLKADWLSRTNLQKADGITAYVLDYKITSYTEYLQPVGTVYKVGDVTDGVFTADYLVSATYIFDVASAASNNDGVSDTTTAAAASTTNSPKTGDVAPIAALAVVMMGACGAMVVASMKRA